MFRQYWEKIDPRTKIIWAVIFSFCLAGEKNLYILLIATILGFILSLAISSSLGKVLKQLGPVNFFILFFWLIVPLSLSGPSLFQIGPLKISAQGLWLCLQLSLKANALMLIFIAYILSLPVSTLGHSLQSLKLSPKLVYLFLFAYRYLFLFKEQKDKLFTALRLRGFKPRTNLLTYKTYAYLIAITILRAYEKGETVHKALILRGFQGKFPNLYPFKFSQLDLYLTLINLFLLASLIYYQIGKGKWMF